MVLDIQHWLPSNASHHLTAMADAALSATAGLQQAFANRDALQVEQKTKGDFVSQADREAEAQIARKLTSAYPDYGWLGEETGSRLGQGTDLHWVVDPLDGTTNFVKGIPHWAISIALCDKDEIVAALVCDPIKNEVFSAERGTGAYLNGGRIWVSDEGDLQNALFATGVPAGARVTYLKAALADIERLMPSCAGIRRGGAAALDLAYVAAGRVEGYWERNLGAWDIAAGLLLVREAGGLVQPLWPNTDILATGSLIASNSELATVLRKNIL